MNNNHSPRGHAPLVVVAAIAIVAALSVVPWEGCTSGKVKNYSLVSDLTGSDSDDDTTSTATADMQWGEEPIADIDTVARAGSDPTAATSTSDSVGTPQAPAELPAEKPKRVGEQTVIEDYSPDQQGLSNIAATLAAGRTARIAVVGDSYIEGDIMTQNLRAQLQDAYGGMGVGYMNMHSDFPGFRQSVTQGGEGWKCYTATKRGREQYMGLAEQYATPAGGMATATYKGSKRLSHASEWSRSQLLFVATSAVTISTRTGAGSEWVNHTFEPSTDVQALTVDTLVSEFDLKSSSSGLVALGAYLDGSGRGIAVDCMSSRGIPGYSLAKISPELCRQMAQWIDYDLIILEFGINVLSPKQTNYSRYADNMVEVIAQLRACYPKARFLVMGIGDRGEKRGGQVKSMSTIPNMIDAQRRAARQAGVLFWDTQDAMGGTDAIVDWAKTGKANKDYIHLTHKGGEALATQLSAALRQMIDR